jgi:hypothetical protein
MFFHNFGGAQPKEKFESAEQDGEVIDLPNANEKVWEQVAR